MILHCVADPWKSWYGGSRPWQSFNCVLELYAIVQMNYNRAGLCG
jgi:hypothetical protein